MWGGEGVIYLQICVYSGVYDKRTKNNKSREHNKISKEQ